MTLLTNNNALPNIILLAMFCLLSTLPGRVEAQSGIATGKTVTTGSSGQRAVFNFLNTTQTPNTTAACDGVGQDPVLTIAQAAGGLPGVCIFSGSNPGYSGLALQQLSTQANIQVNTTVLASPAETSRIVHCLSSNDNGVEEPGCENVAAAGGRVYAAPARTIGGPFGFSVVVRGDKGNQDSVSGQTGFDASAGMLTAGLDYRFSDKLVGGISFSYQHTHLDFDLNSGTLSNDAYRLAPFFSYAVTPSVLVDGLIGVGYLDYESNRTCTGCTQTLSNSASFYGTQWFGSLGIGKSWALGAWALRGYLRGDYVHVNTDAYTEGGTAVAGTSTTTALRVAGQSVDSLTSLLGIQASQAISTSKGVITPSARVEWVHEFKDSPRTLTSQFVSVPVAAPITLTTVGASANWANLGIGLQMNFARSLAGFLEYVYTYKNDARNNQLLLGARYEF